MAVAMDTRMFEPSSTTAAGTRADTVRVIVCVSVCMCMCVGGREVHGCIRVYVCMYGCVCVCLCLRTAIAAVRCRIGRGIRPAEYRD